MKSNNKVLGLRNSVGNSSTCQKSMGFGLRPAGNDGYWGPVTSTLDWCEENYVVSEFLGEFWNSVSCSFHIIASICGIVCLYRLDVSEMRDTFRLPV
ncbi:hypothetical protein BCR33DRAFT_330036 [Rhizoclosmatium globosum]|uniref:Uncharacterized protein n=1 Tax=Rhizoclosmatium globosum TaxID=329046 RepID=A0A1Y2C568_9FUNG|nr:hypothetical protein BCR33DRAFT_330036 [Rhizoclosmatium globosum]|eukprot:ORY42024.1 hypothetical protein BCR33DRAFT_330036 [Rhizoclosmatium globosum]